MEEYRDLHLTIAAFKAVLDEPEFFDYKAGIVLQAYLPDAHLAQQELTTWAKARVSKGGAPIKIRIVKGANLAMERVEAALHGWAQAPYYTKADVDVGIGGHLDVGRVTVLSPVDGSEKWSVEGPANFAQLGFALDSQSDLDFDGRPDVLASAPFFDGAAGVQTGPCPGTITSASKVSRAAAMKRSLPDGAPGFVLDSADRVDGPRRRTAVRVNGRFGRALTDEEPYFCCFDHLLGESR